MAGAGLSAWKPDGIIGNVRLKTEKKLEDTRQAMSAAAQGLTPKREGGTSRGSTISASL